MKAVAPSSGTTAAKKGSSLWWMISLGLHAIVLCVLFVIFPYKEFVKPAARAKTQQPLVNQKTLDATTRRLEEKQSAELARKLRELVALTADIQSVEVAKRVEHAEFNRTFSQLSPELASELIAVARGKLNLHAEKQKAEEETWTAFQNSGAGASATVGNLEDPAFKASIDTQAELLKAASAAQQALSFHQAAVLETQQKLAGRLGFLKTQQAEIVAKQAGLVSAWEKTMDSGGIYASALTRTQELASSISGNLNSLTQLRKILQNRQTELAKLDTSIATRKTTITAAQSALEQLIEKKKNLDPTNQKPDKELDKRIKKGTEDLNRQKTEQGKQSASRQEREKSLQTTEAQLQARNLSVNKSLADLPEVQKSLQESRKGYVAAMAQSIALQTTLDAAMTAALAPSSTASGKPVEP